MRVELGSGKPIKTGTVVHHVGQNIEERKTLVSEQTKQAGRYAWSLLHSYVGCDPQWFALWVHFVPAGCNCQESFRDILARFPPEFSSPDAFWLWGVRLHNMVNEKLFAEGDTSKRVVSIEEAREIWKRPVAA